MVFLLWGSHAQTCAKQAAIDPSRHHLLTAVHPSPLSASKGFFGCRHFSRANELLEAQGKAQINWSQLDNKPNDLIDSTAKPPVPRVVVTDEPHTQGEEYQGGSSVQRNSFSHSAVDMSTSFVKGSDIFAGLEIVLAGHSISEGRLLKDLIVRHKGVYSYLLTKKVQTTLVLLYFIMLTNALHFRALI